MIARAITLFALAGSTFTMCEGSTPPDRCCTSGDSLNVILRPDGDPQARCDDMGGRLAGLVCWDVDF